MSESKAETPKIKRIADLDVDEEMIPTQVLLPEKYYRKLNGLALVKESSKGAIVREALRDYFEKQERIIETPKGSKVADGVLNEILKECRTYWGNFEIEGENGFIAMAKERGLTLKDLTEEQFERVADRLVVGYKGYAEKPTIDEFIGKLSELEPTEEQKDLLREGLGEEEHSEEEWGESEEEEGEEEEEEEW